MSFDLNLFVSCSDVFDMEVLATLRYVCKAFNKCWTRYIRRFLHGNDSEGYILSRQSYNDRVSIYIDIIDMVTFSYRTNISIIMLSKDRLNIRISDSNARPINIEYIRRCNSHDHITKNLIEALEKRNNGISVFKRVSIDQLDFQ